MKTTEQKNRMISNLFVFNVVLVHVSRTWERLRILQPYQEMPLDNIESVDEIVSISDYIMEDDVIKDFILNHNDPDWSWEERTKDVACFSDQYIEHLAETEIIKRMEL